MSQKIKDIYFPLQSALTDDSKTAGSALRELAKRLLAVGKAALQAEKQLLKFDEINRLEAGLLDFTEKTASAKTGSTKSSGTKKTEDEKKKPSPHSSTTHTASERERSRPSPHSRTTHRTPAEDELEALLGFDPAALRRPSSHGATSRTGAYGVTSGTGQSAGTPKLSGSAEASIPLQLSLAAGDILFRWEGLNWEEILAKIITGLCAMSGFLLGSAVLPGAGSIAGLTLGLGLGVTLSSVLFDFDGKLSAEEVRRTVLTALTAVTGGILGFVLGGPAGAAVGATLGLALSILVMRMDDSGLFTALSATFQRLRETITARWESITAALRLGWANLRSWWSSLHLGNFDVRLPHLRVQWQELAPNSILSKYLGLDAIPHLYVEWYARGGIVDGPTLIGAGEQGREAVIPLERHTEWIRMVAQELSRQLQALAPAKAMASLPLPAVATGSLVPPGAGQAPASAGIDFTGLAEAIARAVSEFAERGQREEPVIRVYLDGRQLSDAVTRYQRSAARMYGG